MKAKSGPSRRQEQASNPFSPYYTRLDMKQARASVSFSAELISWLLSVHMALFFLDGNPRKKERVTITGGLSGLAGLTTPLMAVMQLTTGLLSVRARGDSRSVRFTSGVKTKSILSWRQLERGQITKPPLSLEDLVVISTKVWIGLTEKRVHFA